MGKPIRIRAKMKGEFAEVKALMPHVMESGFRRDTETNEVIPAHYITEVVAEHEGEVVMSAYWGRAVSTNPYVAFSFRGAKAGGTVTIRWHDNKGDSTETEAVIK